MKLLVHGEDVHRNVFIRKFREALKELISCISNDISGQIKVAARPRVYKAPKSSRMPIRSNICIQIVSSTEEDMHIIGLIDFAATTVFDTTVRLDGKSLVIVSSVSDFISTHMGRYAP